MHNFACNSPNYPQLKAAEASRKPFKITGSCVRTHASLHFIISPYADLGKLPLLQNCLNCVFCRASVHTQTCTIVDSALYCSALV